MVRCLATTNVLSFVKGVKGLLDTLRLSAALTLRLLLIALTLQLVYKVNGGIYEVVSQFSQCYMGYPQQTPSMAR